MFKRLDHIALHVADVEAVADFYVRHFGCERYAEQVGGRGQAIVYLRLGDGVLELTGRPGGESMSGFHFCIETDDFDGAVARLTAAGVPVAQPPHKTAARAPREANWRRTVFRGPAGELIELRG